jgi:hypothetical protein
MYKCVVEDQADGSQLITESEIGYLEAASLALTTPFKLFTTSTGSTRTYYSETAVGVSSMTSALVGVMGGTAFGHKIPLVKRLSPMNKRGSAGLPSRVSGSSGRAALAA